MRTAICITACLMLSTPAIARHQCSDLQTAPNVKDAESQAALETAKRIELVRWGIEKCNLGVRIQDFMRHEPKYEGDANECMVYAFQAYRTFFATTDYNAHLCMQAAELAVGTKP